jgi:aspartate/methionine/tyrosine aminotransferase
MRFRATIAAVGELPPLSQSALAIPQSVFAELAPRIEAHARTGADLVGLHIGDTYRSPPGNASFARVSAEDDEELYKYGPVVGLEALREAFAARLRARGHGPPSVEGERNVVVACGGTHALFCGARAILEPGDEVLVASPYWPLSVGVLRAAGAIPVEVPLTARLYADPALDPAAVLSACVTPRTRALYITTPNNPDGKVLSAPQLEAIARFALATGIWVIADEVYADYVYDGEHRSIARCDGMSERTVSVYSLSKSHGLAGARIGFLVAPERVTRVARRVATHTVFHVPLAAQRVGLVAASGDDSWIDDARRDYHETRDSMVRAFDGAGVRITAPQGGSYVFIDFAPLLGGRRLKELLERCIDRGVLLAPGEAFGAPFASWARLCFTSVARARLLEGVARLREAMRDLSR